MEILESTHPPRSQIDATVALCKAIFYYKRDHPDNEQMNAWTDDIMVLILTMKETNSMLSLSITNAEYNRIVHLTYISTFTNKIEEYIDLAMQDACPPSLLECISTPTHISVSSSNEEDPNHPGEDWIKYNVNNIKHYPLVFINEDGREKLARYIHYLNLGDGVTLQGRRTKYTAIYATPLHMQAFLLRSSGLKVRRAQRCLRRVEWLKSLEYPKTDSRVVR